jgi:hypothetical protein
MAQLYIHEMYGSSRGAAMKAPANSNTYQEGQIRAPGFSPSSNQRTSSRYESRTMMGMRIPRPKRDPQLGKPMIGLTLQKNGIEHWFGPQCKTSRRHGRLPLVSQGHASPYRVVAYQLDSDGLMSQSTSGSQSTRLRDQRQRWEGQSDHQTDSLD